MDSSQPEQFYLRSTSALSLNERFSQVLMDPLTCSRMVTFDPVLLQQRRKMCDAASVVLLVKRETSWLPGLQTANPSVRVGQRRRRRRRKRSVWTRLGWRRATQRPRGFWSFRNKYKWRAGFTSTGRRRGKLCSLGQRGVLMKRNIQKVTAGRTQLSLHLQRGGATASRGRGQSKVNVPTRKQLDAQLDEYMSMSKSRLDKQLDDYMSMSKSRLDAQLDEYMSMAGQTDLDWD
ncbi:chromatin target of PRMT1 protein-like [Morone saxatilis]|uniref:chromatin target of PRMT1 protein-like n=1 Tax=Morone saxatilis TaxID=34816 RepID=UPI0015E221E0|nr:chromatin target of PRMT1 protein-like [Morone saxatilis]